jgi:hypothetical protein
MRVDVDGLHPQSRQITKPADSQVVHSTSRRWAEGKGSYTSSAPSGKKEGWISTVVICAIMMLLGGIDCDPLRRVTHCRHSLDASR